MTETVYALKLKAKCAPASFMAGHQAVELAKDGDVFKTTDRRAYEQLRVLPFLEDVTNQTQKTTAEADS